MVFARIHLEVLFANATLAIQAMLPSQMDAQVFLFKKGGKSSAVFLLDEVDPMPLGLDKAESMLLRSNEAESTPLGSDMTGLSPSGLGVMGLSP